MFDIEVIGSKYAVSEIKKIFIQYFAVLFICLLAALAATLLLRAKYVYLAHTILELVCIHIAISTFLIVWNTYEKSHNMNHIIGFGFLSVAIFDAFHTYYFFGFRALNQGYPELYVRYWVIGRFTEVVVLAAVSLGAGKYRINKWIGICFTIFLSLGISLVLLFYPWVLPAMMMEEGLTPVKIGLEYLIIAITVISLRNLKYNARDKNYISYRHIFMALLFIIPVELIFILFKESTTFYSIYNHLIKIVYYWYIYNAVFVSAIEYPYKRLDKMYHQEKLALVGRMTAGIVHEIKNSLAAIKGAAQVIELKTKDEKIKEYSSIISKEAGNIDSVVYDLLNFAKPKTSVKKETCLNAVAKTMKVLIEALSFTKNIHSEFIFTERELPITADESKLHQVILNILENAIDAVAGVKNPLLIIKTAYNSAANEAVLSIEDNGIGMTEDQRMKLGTAFFTNKAKGTGLGLNICYDIINDHGGRIEVESKPKKGTIFRIILPLSRDMSEKAV